MSQGMEKDVIVLSTTITRPSTAFASDACRLNVALTRARRNLLLVGCAPVLQQVSPAFALILAKCRATPGSYFPGGRPILQSTVAASTADLTVGSQEG